MSLKTKYDLIFISPTVIAIVVIMLLIIMPDQYAGILFTIFYLNAVWLVIRTFILKSMTCPECDTPIMKNIMQKFAPKQCRKCKAKHI